MFVSSGFCVSVLYALMVLMFQQSGDCVDLREIKKTLRMHCRRESECLLCS